jgi:alpha-D-ribose 1-methylphosphonate 5-triphosphate synthase subunit PhnI
VGYAGARGGLDAIRAAEDLVRRERLVAPSAWLDAAQLTERQRFTVDRVMGEGGLWDPFLASAALRQAEGDLIEAAHLLRSYRSSLPRLGYSVPVSTDEITVLRRVVPAFRTPPRPQLLGRTTDYTGRLLDRRPEHLARAEADKLAADETIGDVAIAEDLSGDAAPAAPALEPTDENRRPRRLLDVLRDLDLVVDRRREDDPEPFDITKSPARPPAPRSARLAVMARAETGALVNLWYRNILGPDGYLHEITLGEVRHGRLPVRITHPVTGGPCRSGTFVSPRWRPSRTSTGWTRTVTASTSATACASATTRRRRSPWPTSTSPATATPAEPRSSSRC